MIQIMTAWIMIKKLDAVSKLQGPVDKAGVRNEENDDDETLDTTTPPPSYGSCHK